MQPLYYAAIHPLTLCRGIGAILRVVFGSATGRLTAAGIVAPMIASSGVSLPTMCYWQPVPAVYSSPL
jgi:H+/gluconate symporter-like permease